MVRQTGDAMITAPPLICNHREIDNLVSMLATALDLTAEYYGDLYKRYATYVRSFGGNQIFKIACGPNGGDYRWTEVMMREIPHGLPE